MIKKVAAPESPMPALELVYSRLEFFAKEIFSLSNEIAYRINIIKQFPVEALSKFDNLPLEDPQDIVSNIGLQVSELENSRQRLEDILSHLRTIA